VTTRRPAVDVPAQEEGSTDWRVYVIYGVYSLQVYQLRGGSLAMGRVPKSVDVWMQQLAAQQQVLIHFRPKTDIC
jgi:hypothetical protein